jgi:hypothetical protein
MLWRLPAQLPELLTSFRVCSASSAWRCVVHYFCDGVAVDAAREDRRDSVRENHLFDARTPLYQDSIITAVPHPDPRHPRMKRTLASTKDERQWSKQHSWGSA